MSVNEEQLRLIERIAEISQGGMPLPAGWRAVAEESSSRRMAKQLRKLAGDLESGRTWEEVLLSDEHGLSPHLIGLVRAGVRSGNLGDALNGLIDHHREQKDVWRQLTWSMAYPLTVFGFAIALLLFAVMAVVPPMREIFQDFGTELPALTRFWIEVSRILPPLVLVASLGFFVLLLLVRMFGGRVGWSRFIASIPMFGPMIHWASVAEFIRLLQLMTVQQIQLPEALRLTSSAVGNANMALLANWLADGTERGVTLSDLMDATPRVPAFIVPVIRWGERQNSLEEALGNVYDLLVGRIRLRSTLTSTTITPLVFIFVVSLIAALVVGMFMPLVSLIQNLT